MEVLETGEWGAMLDLVFAYLQACFIFQSEVAAVAVPAVLRAEQCHGAAQCLVANGLTHTGDWAA